MAKVTRVPVMMPVVPVMTVPVMMPMATVMVMAVMPPAITNLDEAGFWQFRQPDRSAEVCSRRWLRHLHRQAKA